MPVLQNSRHEAFAQGLANGKSAAQAYVDAGYRGDRTAASRLSTNVNVQRRVEELQSRIADKAEWTAADRLKMLAEIANRSATADPRVAVSAIAEANKMQGSHAPVRQDHTSSDGTMRPAPPTVIRIIAADDGSDDQAAAEAGTSIQ